MKYDIQPPQREICWNDITDEMWNWINTNGSSQLSSTIKLYFEYILYILSLGSDKNKSLLKENV